MYQSLYRTEDGRFVKKCYSVEKIGNKFLQRNLMVLKATLRCFFCSFKKGHYPTAKVGNTSL